MRDATAQLLRERLHDERGGEVVFVSHCLLNENTRYLGGAFRTGSVAEVVAALQERGAGIHQMPCPEQHAWGGVLKRRMLTAYGSKGTVLYALRRPLLALFVWQTRRVYARLAREVVAEIEDYTRSGFRVLGIVGVGASPSCGVQTTLDIAQSFDVMASTAVDEVDRAAFNKRGILECRRAGNGLFVAALRRRLARRGLDVRFLEHDLVAEMDGRQQPPLELS